ncbi:hypothetical protein [Brumimicrobium mesophilum]|uniref:hypothetical protein n=1 Tax=Brumimicrobium mesophilum TaxID=392717 RepID=UPI000D141F23|nr:hypothetical protein [Brumimicrobium mesophilum]
MYIAVSEENRIVLEELKGELIQIKQEVIELSISLVIQLKTLLFQFLLSYKEYSLTNIREYGLAEILMSRANRFFKLDQDDEKEKKAKEKKKAKFRFKLKKEERIVQFKSKNAVNTRENSKSKSKIGARFILQKCMKLILFPFYIFILIISILFELDESKKNNKNVKNTYRP